MVCALTVEENQSKPSAFSGFEPNAEPERYNVAPPSDEWSNRDISENVRVSETDTAAALDRRRHVN